MGVTPIKFFQWDPEEWKWIDAYNQEKSMSFFRYTVGNARRFQLSKLDWTPSRTPHWENFQIFEDLWKYFWRL